MDASKIPAGSARIRLTSPIVGHGGTISEVIMRPPNARDFFALGEPHAQAFSNPGADTAVVYQAENVDTVRAYLGRLVIEPDVLLMEDCSLVDAMRIKAALFRFFTDAREAQSETLATPSSSTSESSTPPAAAS